MIKSFPLQFGLGVEIFLQALQHLLWRGSCRLTLNGLSILVDNKLCEIPLDGINQSSALFLLQVLEQWMSFLSVDINLVEQVKVHLVILDEALDFFGVAWFLIAKLIAGEGENTQTCGEKRRKVYDFSS